MTKHTENKQKSINYMNYCMFQGQPSYQNAILLPPSIPLTAPPPHMTSVQLWGTSVESLIGGGGSIRGSKQGWFCCWESKERVKWWVWRFLVCWLRPESADTRGCVYCVLHSSYCYILLYTVTHCRILLETVIDCRRLLCTVIHCHRLLFSVINCYKLYALV